jgi:ApaG protein
MNNIRIDVQTKFLPEESNVHGEYIWTYFITITNISQQQVQLISRHWQITDESNEVSEVIGEGVVGVQPIIEVGQSFEYNSFVALKTPSGMMSGNYTMKNDQNEEFTALIPPFYLQTLTRLEQ